MTQKTFIAADHGLALIYFLQSDVISTLIEAGVEVIMLVDDDALPAIEARFGRPGLTFEGMRLDKCQEYFRSFSPVAQRWLVCQTQVTESDLAVFYTEE